MQESVQDENITAADVNREGAGGGDSAPARTPGPQGLIAADGKMDPLAFLGDLVERYGDVVTYQTRFGRTMLFTHPEDVGTILHSENFGRSSLLKMMLGEGLLTSDGPKWRPKRRLMQPEFLPQRFAEFAPAITRQTAKTAALWEAAARSGETIDLTLSMTKLTLRIICEVLFSEDLSETHLAELCNAVAEAVLYVGRISSTIFGQPLNFAPDSMAQFGSHKQAIDVICYEMISRRRAKAPEERPRDLLTMLIEARPESGPLSDVALRDEVVTMMVGGHETTALALSWAWKLLWENRQVEEKLRMVAISALNGRTAAAEEIGKLGYARAVFQEAMRLYPPVWNIGRGALRDDVIGGHAVAKGTSVLTAAWFTHRHKKFWPDPERFDPERFADGAGPRHRYAFFPFGGGRHQCIGMPFALMEGTMILAQLAQSFRVELVNAKDVKPNPGITLRPIPSMLARVRRHADIQKAEGEGRGTA